MNLQVEPDNLLEFLENTVKNYPDQPAFGTKNTSGVYE